MKLSKSSKIAIIAATLLMPIYLVLFMTQIFMDMGDASGESFLFRHFEVFFAIHGFVMLLQFVLIVFYIVYLFKTSRVPAEQKALWAIVLFMGAPVAMPVFWFLYVWREPGVAAA